MVEHFTLLLSTADRPTATLSPPSNRQRWRRLAYAGSPTPCRPPAVEQHRGRMPGSARRRHVELAHRPPIPPTASHPARGHAPSTLPQRRLSLAVPTAAGQLDTETPADIGQDAADRPPDADSGRQIRPGRVISARLYSTSQQRRRRQPVRQAAFC